MMEMQGDPSTRGCRGIGGVDPTHRKKQMRHSVNEFGTSGIERALTFLPLHLWPSASGGHSAGKFLEVDVAVLVLVQR